MKNAWDGAESPASGARCVGQPVKLSCELLLYSMKAKICLKHTFSVDGLNKIYAVELGLGELSLHMFNNAVSEQVFIDEELKTPDEQPRRSRIAFFLDYLIDCSKISFFGFREPVEI